MLNESIKLKDIGGYEYQKEEANKIVNFFLNYDNYVKNGAHLPHGIVFYGHPGTGKTMFATAIANESKAKLFSLTDEQFYDDTNLSRSVQKTFESAKANAPSIILIDEIDQLVQCERYVGMNPPTDKQSEMLRVLLTEIDKLNNSGVLVVATANVNIDTIPAALVRNGRIEKHISIGVPDYEDRKSILELYLRKSDIFNKIKAEKLAKVTRGLVGSSLASLINDVLIKCLSNNIANARYVDFYEPIQIIISNGIKKKPNKDNRYIIYHEIGHLLVNYSLNHEYGFISAESFGNSSGRMARIAGKDDKELITFDDVLKQAAVAVAGLAATEIFLGKKCSGATADLQNVFQYFNFTLASGLHSDMHLVSLQIVNAFGGFVSTPKSRSYYVGFQKFLESAYELASNILKGQAKLAQKFYQELTEKKSLSSDEVENIIKNYEKYKK